MRWDYIKEKGYKVEEMRECEWWENLKNGDKIINYVRTRFPYKIHPSTDSFFAKIKVGSLYGYVQFYLVVSDDFSGQRFTLLSSC